MRVARRGVWGGETRTLMDGEGRLRDGLMAVRWTVFIVGGLGQCGGVDLMVARNFRRGFGC